MRFVRLLPIAVFGVFGCAQGGETEYEDAVTADPNHYKVEFENDVVRVVRVAYGPNEESVMHQHPNHCAVTLSSGAWQMTTAEGEVVDAGGEVGELLCVDAGAHRPRNTSAQPGEAVLFEFKEGGTAGTSMSHDHPDAVAADPDHYSVEFENDVVRILRIRYGPGETSTMHYHPANCSVDLSGGMWRMTDPAGGETEDQGDFGQAQCGDASAHLPQNLSDEDAEVVLVEFIGRETFE